jgi:hypothetical protein
MFRWKTPLGSDNAVKHGAHNQKKHGNRGGAVMAGARVKFKKAQPAGDGVAAPDQPMNETEALTYQTALDVARSQGKDDELAQRFAARALEIARSAPLSVSDKSVDEVHALLIEKMRQSQYSDDQYVASRTYYSGESLYINGTLRGNPDYLLPQSTMENLVPLLDDLTRGADRIPENMQVVRGLKLTVEQLESWKTGAVVADKGYMSTSIRQDFASKYAASTKYGIVSVMINIRVPAGQQAMNMNSLFATRDQNKGKEDYIPRVHKGEIVFPRNTNMLIRGMEERNGVWYIDAEMLPDD